MGQTDIEHKLVARPVNLTQDYAAIKGLWESHGSNAPPLDVFSPNGKALPPQGIIVENKGMAICCVFMYHTGASMCMMEFMVSNACAPKSLRDPALNLMLKTGVAWTRENGYNYCYTATSSDKFMKRLESIGFNKKGTRQQHMFWGLDDGK